MKNWRVAIVMIGVLLAGFTLFLALKQELIPVPKFVGGGALLAGVWAVVESLKVARQPVDAKKQKKSTVFVLFVVSGVGLMIGGVLMLLD